MASNSNCLNDNTPALMAIVNDDRYDDIFKNQLQNFIIHHDLLFIFSGSGNSKNIINALTLANQINAKTLAITGFDGGIAKQVKKHDINVFDL